jgi:hypothetical protein
MENRRADANDEHQEMGRYAHLLNENHRRVLSTVLMRLELATWRLEERLQHETPPSLALTRFTGIPDAGQRAELLQLIALVRQKLAQLTRDYDLEAREDDLTRIIQAEFSLLWSDLEDTRPHKLRNYGELHPRAKDILGPQMQELIEMVLAIDRAAR